MSVSHDEVLEALATNSLHTPLQEVMAAKDATQAVVSKLCDAARVNDTDTIKVVMSQSVVMAIHTTVTVCDDLPHSFPIQFSLTVFPHVNPPITHVLHPMYTQALHTQHPHVFSTTADMTSFATGETPQGAAARANAIEALSLLLDLGLDPEQRDMTGVSPLEVGMWGVYLGCVWGVYGGVG